MSAHGSDYDEEMELMPADFAAKGLPEEWAGPPGIMIVILECGVFPAIGLLIAYGLTCLAGVEATADQVAAAMQAAHPAVGTFYLAVLLCTLVPRVNYFFGFKGRALAHVDNPDQFVFKAGGPGMERAHYVMLEQEGPVGVFNRAQRAINNFNETAPQVLCQALLGGFVFPEPALYCCIAYFLFSLSYSHFYMQGNMARYAGYMPRQFSQNGLLGLHILACYKLRAAM